MPTSKGKIPRISVRAIAPFQLSDENWLAIEAASGNSLSPEVRGQIETATTQFLEEAEAENTGSMDDAIARVERMRKAAQSLLDAMADSRGGNVTLEYVNEELDMSYTRLIGAELCRLLRVPALPSAGLNYVFELYKDLAHFVGACGLALGSLDSASRYNYWPEGGAWEHWIRQLTDILEAHHLPTGVRKDAAGYRVKRASPFVKFVSALQTFLPKKHVRGDHTFRSDSASTPRRMLGNITP
jgi:hypothetical protein